MKRSIPQLALVASLVGPGLICAQLDAKFLDEVAKKVIPLVEKASKTTAPDGLRFRIVEQGELAEAVAEQMFWRLKVKLKDEKKAVAAAKRLGRMMGSLLLAKFDWNNNTILVCPANFRAQAKAISDPDLVSRETFIAVMVHECVHAMDEKKYQWSKKLNSILEEAPVNAFIAVVEGHAQMLASRICQENGWAKGFATFTRTIGKLPPDLGEGEKLLVGIMLANISAAYHDGMSFMQFLFEKNGEAGIAAAFKNPPTDLQAVLQPQWYLDPKLRPERLYDFTKPMAQFLRVFNDEDWSNTKVVLSRPQLKTALALLPREQVRQLLDNLRSNEMLVMNDKNMPGSRVVVGALFEFSSPRMAMSYVLAAEQLLKIKAEKMKTGKIRIIESKISRVQTSMFQGIFVRQTVRNQGMDIPVASVVAARGAVAVELLYSNEEVERDELIKLAGKMLTLSVNKKQLTSKATGKQAGKSGSKPTSKPSKKNK